MVNSVVNGVVNAIDNEVIKSIKKGNMSSLNCPEEVFLSEKLLKMQIFFYWKVGVVDPSQ